jgi:hypothetical protein
MAGRVAYYGGIVKDGLVLNLDAAKRDSYPGTGTTWRDISGTTVTGSLVNGPTFNSDNGGSIVFDGVDDYATGFGDTSTFSFIQNTGIFTISAWIRLTDFANSRYILGNNNGTGGAKGLFIGYETTNQRFTFSLTNGATSFLVFRRNSLITNSNYTYVTYTGNGVNSTLYKDGVFVITSNNYGTLSTGNSTNELGVGRVNNLSNTYWQGNISVVQIYNRALTAQEVLQNYNATKGRYGL